MDFSDNLPNIGNKSGFLFASLGVDPFSEESAYILELRGRFFEEIRHALGDSTNKIGFSGFKMGRKESTILKHEV